GVLVMATQRSQGRVAMASFRRARVPSVDPSSTMMASKESPELERAAPIWSTRGAMFSSSLWAGATTDRSMRPSVGRSDLRADPPFSGWLQGTVALGSTGRPGGPTYPCAMHLKHSDREHGPDVVPVTFILEDPESVAGTEQKEHQHKAGVGESL